MNARRLALPVIALVAGLLATLAATLMMARAEEGRRQARFDGLAQSAVSAIESRMLAHLTLLRGTAGLFNASEQVTERDFSAYIERLDLAHNHPGVLGIGYAAYAPDRPGLDRIIGQAERTGQGQIRFRPPGDRPDYSAIIYIEPESRANQDVLGFDMMSEAVRRAAMTGARTSGAERMSGRVQLAQDRASIRQPGFLVYTPLFRSADGTFYGWVYSPLRAFDLFGAIFAKRDLTEIVVEVFDREIGRHHLLYHSAPAGAGARYSATRNIQIAGRQWLVRVSSSPAFIRDTAVQAPLGVAIAGSLISFLLAALLFLQGQWARRTEETVRLRTAELRTANERLVAEAEGRRQAEAKVAQMQKTEAIGQLTGGIAHDFNNMLTVVIGNLDLAERRIDQPERLAQAIANASEGAQKAAELTQRLLAFGRQQTLRPQVIGASDLISGLTEMLSRTLGQQIQLETALSPTAWPVCVDPAQLESAILNLAINARDAMSGGGCLQIATRNVELRPGDVSDMEGPVVGDHVLIAVSDTGHGMTPAVAARALDPFFTTKEVGRGSGLGLSQVYGFVRQSDGHLRIDSTVGAGTTICIYLPRYTGQPVRPASLPAREASLPRARSGEAVLVVEDEDRVRDISTEMLRDLGYAVVAASNGPNALALLDQHADVQMIFTDVVMPGMNGRELADQALSRRPDLKILFTTGHTRGEIVQGGRLDDDVALLQKPFTAAQLAAAVRATLDA